MISFIDKFSLKNGNLEFVLSDSNISKVLFWSKSKNNNKYIYNYIFNSPFFKKSELKKLDFLFEYFKEENIHFGCDFSTNRFKLYLGLYNYDFKSCLNKISYIKDNLGIEYNYFLEKDFLKFDCLGFDFSEKGLDMKVYELVKNDNNFSSLPIYIDKNNIKEIGYLKNFTGRKKKFYRFNNYQDLSLFKNNFDFSVLDDFERSIKKFYILKKTVKYYCLEEEKKEIYFI